MLNIMYFIIMIICEKYIGISHYIFNLVTIIFLFFYNILLNQHIQTISNFWILCELINWIAYLYMYIKIINPSTLYLKKEDINKVVNKMDKLDNFDLEHIIKGSILYDKTNHKSINYETFDIRDLTRKEIMILLGYTLFGIDQDKIFRSDEVKRIYKLMLKIETKLNCEFKMENMNRYLYKSWGRDFISFHFRPLIFQIPIRLLINIFHYYMIYKLKFKYKICNKSKIGYLYKDRDNDKKDLIFIHGFGLGYLPYILRLKELNKQFNLIIMILPNISSYTYYDDLNCGYFPSHELIRDSFYDFMSNFKVKKINILSHSFGTYITQIIRNDTRNKIINRIILVDPIIFWVGCFKMSLYIDKIAQRGSSILGWILEILTNYLIFKCLYLRYICYRVMFGPDFLVYNSYELEDKNILLVLEYDDQVIPAEIIYNKIKDKKISYYYLKNAEHGTLLLSSKFNNIFSEIINYI
jgi:hypothetical protein